jgi:hypothetical protein
MKDQKMIVIGNVDPVDVVKKLKKFWHTEILTVGPAKVTYYYTPHPEEYQNNCVIC